MIIAVFAGRPGGARRCGICGDGDESTVFARSLSKQSDSAVLFSVDFTVPTGLDGFRIRAGYFDGKYFAKNHRIQKIKIVIRPADLKNPKFAREFVLEDIMEAQDLLLGVRQNASGVDIIVNSVYEGSQWKDVVVSGISFLRDGAELKNTFKHSPQDNTDSFSSSQEEHQFTYNEAGQPVKESWNYHKMGWRKTYSTYNPEGLLIFRLNRTVDPEKLTDHSVSVKTWLYKGDLLTQEEISAINLVGNEYTDKTEYLYKDGKAIGERRTYTFSEQISRTLYHYLYDGPKIHFKITVLEDKGFSSFPEELFYKNGLLAETRSSYFTEWSSR